MAVVGAGPAGMEAAWVAAAQGHAVVLYEASDSTGGALAWTRRMPLRAEFGELLDYLRRQLARFGVDVCHGPLPARIEADAIAVAIGAEPQAETFEGGGRGLTLEAALADPEALYDDVVVQDRLGSWAVIGVVEYLADLGKRVTLVAPTGTPGWTVNIYSSFAMRRRLADKGVRIRPLQGIRAAIDGIELLDLATGSTSRIDGPASVIAPSHAVPRRLDAELAGRHRRIGDAAAARTALEAVYEGHEWARGLHGGG